MLAMNDDAQLIEQLGGAAKVASLIGLGGPGGTRRVCNWKTRGIPAKVKVAFPHIFMVRWNSKPAETKAA